jgi:murein DD-endopeptidase MepM/ murein hydrolase activator NlpD
MATLACVVCKTPIDEGVGDRDRDRDRNGDDGARFVLLRGRHEELHCSQVCLVANVERRRLAHTALRRRWLLRAAAVALVVVGAPRLWHRVRLPPPQSISFDPPQLRPIPTPRPLPPMFGPAWPPTDEDWQLAFAHTAWTYPLPGPARRAPVADDHLLPTHSSGARHPDPLCRAPGKCGVDLGGDLWGEHVYAAHDGVVDHVQRGTGDERGDVYVRLSHFGGMVFTHYAHLAAAPRGIVRGAAVKAGDLIGLVGDTGTEHPGRYIHFALSIRPSVELPEIYWDPTTLMAHWPLRLPPHGTVAGFVPSESDLTLPAFHRRSR